MPIYFLSSSSLRPRTTFYCNLLHFHQGTMFRMMKIFINNINIDSSVVSKKKKLKRFHGWTIFLSLIFYPWSQASFFHFNEIQRPIISNANVSNPWCLQPQVTTVSNQKAQIALNATEGCCLADPYKATSWLIPDITKAFTGVRSDWFFGDSLLNNI